MNFFEKPEIFYSAGGREITGNYSGNIVQQKGITSLKPKQQIGCCPEFMSLHFTGKSDGIPNFSLAEFRR